jgi:adenosylhomocysteine nucleosidase
MAFQLDFGATLTDEIVVGGEEERGKVGDVTLERQRCAVIAFVGLAFEARIAAGPGVHVVCRTAGNQLERVAETAARQGYRGVISFGVAGGLAAHLKAGDWVVASAIREPHSSHSVRPTHAAWSRKLLGLIGHAVHAPIVGVDAPVADPAKKRELHRATGAVAVDMESHLMARVAAAYDLAFAAVRVVVDPAHRRVPPAALLNMRPDGRADTRAMMRNIIASPSQISPLARIAMDAFTARAQMHRVRELLGHSFGFAEA